ncbi:MAG: hypothetical protein WD696_23180 [Bryobacteraceae bacterium]
MRLPTLLLLLPLALHGDKDLTFEERVELVRGLTAEFATVKQHLPRSKKPLPIETSGQYDKQHWEEAGRELGPAARVGDLVQITKVSLDDDKITLEINNGWKGGRKWYDRIQVGMGTGGGTRPINQNPSTAPGGTSIVVLFHKPIPALKAAEVKKMLAPVLDFERRTATELYAESLPPEIQKAIKEKRVQEGMDRDQVILSLGRPIRKQRETKDGVELEDWIYGQAPGRITFVTFEGSKVVKVKESYAGLGAEAAAPLPPK